MPGSTFQTNPYDLDKLLQDCHRGTLQLPDFQRSWVWDEDRIKSLIASASQAFPVGALMTLDTGGEVNFKPRPVACVTPTGTGWVLNRRDDQRRHCIQGVVIPLRGDASGVQADDGLGCPDAERPGLRVCSARAAAYSLSRSMPVFMLGSRIVRPTCIMQTICRPENSPGVSLSV